MNGESSPACQKNSYRRWRRTKHITTRSFTSGPLHKSLYTKPNRQKKKQTNSENVAATPTINKGLVFQKTSLDVQANIQLDEENCPPVTQKSRNSAPRDWSPVNKSCQFHGFDHLSPFGAPFEESNTNSPMSIWSAADESAAHPSKYPWVTPSDTLATTASAVAAAMDTLKRTDRSVAAVHNHSYRFATVTGSMDDSLKTAPLRNAFLAGDNGSDSTSNADWRAEFRQSFMGPHTHESNSKLESPEHVPLGRKHKLVSSLLFGHTQFDAESICKGILSFDAYFPEGLEISDDSTDLHVSNGSGTVRSKEKSLARTDQDARTKATIVLEAFLGRSSKRNICLAFLVAKYWSCLLLVVIFRTRSVGKGLHQVPLVGQQTHQKATFLKPFLKPGLLTTLHLCFSALPFVDWVLVQKFFGRFVNATQCYLNRLVDLAVLYLVPFCESIAVDVERLGVDLHHQEFRDEAAPSANSAFPHFMPQQNFVEHSTLMFFLVPAFLNLMACWFLFSCLAVVPALGALSVTTAVVPGLIYLGTVFLSRRASSTQYLGCRIVITATVIAWVICSTSLDAVIFRGISFPRTAPDIQFDASSAAGPGPISELSGPSNLGTTDISVAEAVRLSVGVRFLVGVSGALIQTAAVASQELIQVATGTPALVAARTVLCEAAILALVLLPILGEILPGPDYGGKLESLGDTIVVLYRNPYILLTLSIWCLVTCASSWTSYHLVLKATNLHMAAIGLILSVAVLSTVEFVPVLPPSITVYSRPVFDQLCLIIVVTCSLIGMCLYSGFLRFIPRPFHLLSSSNHILEGWEVYDEIQGRTTTAVVPVEDDPGSALYQSKLPSGLVEVQSAFQLNYVPCCFPLSAVDASKCN